MSGQAHCRTRVLRHHRPSLVGEQVQASSALSVRREHYRPSAEALAAVTAPVQLLVSEHGRAPLHAAAGQLAERLGVPLTRVPGTHTPRYSHGRGCGQRENVRFHLSL